MKCKRCGALVSGTGREHSVFGCQQVQVDRLAARVAALEQGRSPIADPNAEPVAWMVEYEVRQSQTQWVARHQLCLTGADAADQVMDKRSLQSSYRNVSDPILLYRHPPAPVAPVAFEVEKVRTLIRAARQEGRLGGSYEQANYHLDAALALLDSAKPQPCPECVEKDKEIAHIRAVWGKQWQVANATLQERDEEITRLRIDAALRVGEMTGLPCDKE